MRRIYALTLVAAAVSICGCQPRAVPRPASLYDGPTEPMVDVVEAINQNNQALPTLWAAQKYVATVVDDKRKTFTFSGDGVLLYRRDRDLRLIGNKAGLGTVFEVGSLRDRFWLKLVPEVETLWWGFYEHVGKPCAQSIPIRPDLVVEVLGVSTFNTNFNELPVPTMRFNNEQDAYMFVWNTKLPDRWAAIKEIWYDRKTRQPVLVKLYDADGRVLLRALLENHRPVEVQGRSREKWPTVATSFTMFFPESGTRMAIQLTDVILDKRGSPSRRGIEFPNLKKPGVRTVVQIDEGCESE